MRHSIGGLRSGDATDNVQHALSIVSAPTAHLHAQQMLLAEEHELRLHCTLLRKQAGTKTGLLVFRIAEGVQGALLTPGTHWYVGR